MKAKEFFEQFIERINDKSNDAVKYYCDSKEYTKFIFPIIESILDANGEKNICKYYNVDVFSWKDLKDEIAVKELKGFKKYCWEPLTAIEHENTYSSWLDEVVKLAYIYASLRVVIGYLPVKQSHRKYIDYVSRVYSHLKNKCRLKDDDAFLLIIGNALCQDKYEYFNYRPYLYNQDEEKFVLQQDWNNKINIPCSLSF